MKKTKILALGLAALMGLAPVTACSQGGSGENSEPQSSQKESGGGENKSGADQPEKHWTIYTIRSEDLPSYQCLDYVLEKYKDEVNPNVSWDHIYIADRPTYLQKIKTLIAANDAPVMFDEDPDPYTAQLYQEGVLKDLTQFCEDNNIADYFYPAAFDWCKFSDGTVIGLPSQYTIEMFWYNTEYFENAGAEPPEYLDDFMATCQKLKDAGYTPMSISGVESWTMLRVLEWTTFRLEGNQYLLDCARGIRKYSEPTGMQAAQFLYDLGANGYLHENFAAADLAEAQELFTTGQTAMYYIGSWEMSAMLDKSLSDDMKGKIDYFTLPEMREGTTNANQINVAGGTPMCFSAEKWDEQTEQLILYYCQYMGDYQSQYEFTPAKGYEAPKGETEHDQQIIDRIAEDMANVEGVIRLYDLEFDPTTNTNNGPLAVSLALNDITPEEFCAAVDESVEQNAADWFDDVAEELLKAEE